MGVGALVEVEGAVVVDIAAAIAEAGPDGVVVGGKKVVFVVDFEEAGIVH